MNNLLSYCGLVNARISASEKYLPVSVFDLINKLYLKAKILEYTDRNR